MKLNTKYGMKNNFIWMLVFNTQTTNIHNDYLNIRRLHPFTRGQMTT